MTAYGPITRVGYDNVIGDRIDRGKGAPCDDLCTPQSRAEGSHSEYPRVQPLFAETCCRVTLWSAWLCTDCMCGGGANVPAERNSRPPSNTRVKGVS